MNNSSTLRTSISPSLLKWRLYLGSFLAGGGAFLLLFSSIYLSTSVLEKWGFLILILGLGLIAIGLIPYRKLQRLEVKPNELILSEHGLAYYKGGRLEWKLPYDSIRSVTFFESSWRYGIYLDVEGRFDLFLPFFTKRSFQILEQNFKDRSE
jgi:hypothetical protein